MGALLGITHPAEQWLRNFLGVQTGITRGHWFLALGGQGRVEAQNLQPAALGVQRGGGRLPADQPQLDGFSILGSVVSNTLQQGRVRVSKELPELTLPNFLPHH